MSNYPKLRELGVNNPDQITTYLLYQSYGSDILRVKYKRKKGSLLPQSKRFKFGRAEKYVIVDSGTGKGKTVHEISPFLQGVLAELDRIVKVKKSDSVQKKEVLTELKSIREEVEGRLHSLEQMLEKMEE